MADKILSLIKDHPGGVISTVLHVALLRKVSKGIISLKTSGRIASSITAGLLGLSSLYYVFINQTSAYPHFIDYINGYLIADTLVLLAKRREYDNEWKLYVFHHLMGLYIFYKTRIVHDEWENTTPTESNNTLEYYLAIGLFAELTTLSMNISWLLIKMGMQETLLFKMSALTVVGLFVPCRIINYAYNIYHVGGRLPPTLLIGFVTSLTLNLWWFRKLVSKVINTINK